MVAVCALSWKEVSPNDFESHARQAFCAAVTDVADRANATLHVSHTRIDQAGALPSREEECPMILARYGRFWAVYEAGVLVCVCVYKRGAAEVIPRLTQVAHGRAAQ
jgi:hypothetical protein